MDLISELQRTAEAWRSKAAKVREQYRDTPITAESCAVGLETCAEDVESLVWQMRHGEENPS
jgi:hypothetical protein